MTERSASLPMQTLTGKVAVVTGGASELGIGAAIARRFARGGASLFLTDVAPVERTVAQCVTLAATGARIEGRTFDLTARGGAEAMIAAALEAFGRVDVLCNNAGLRISKPFGTFTREDFDRCVQVNLAAPFFASQAVLPAMRRQGGGRIIHTASQLGSVASGTRAIYGLTKAALIHLTKSMALELGPEGIIVNAISPGPTYTGPIIERERQDPALAKQRVARVPLGRYGKPEEIAELAWFLATTPAQFLHGANLVIDGGYTAW
jgi:NAD(P)-dependent dehydrogenase (short-subunit alcohol dehydrogenase family)